MLLSMIKKSFVEKKKYFTENELSEIAAIAQSSPGAIAINMTALAGYRVMGIAGAIVSAVSAVIPPLIIIAVVSVFYDYIRDNQIVAAALKGMEAGVAAVIVDVVINMYRTVLQRKDAFLSMIVPIAFVLNFVLGINVMFVIPGCIAASLIVMLISKRAGGRGQ